VLCTPVAADQLTVLLFRETTTLGVRRSNARRRTLQREIVDIETSLGTVRMEVGRLNGIVLNAELFSKLAKLAGSLNAVLKKR